MDITLSADDSFILVCPTCCMLTFDPKVCINCSTAIPPFVRIKILRQDNTIVEVTGLQLNNFSRYTEEHNNETLPSRFELKVGTYRSEKQSKSRHTHGENCACIKYLKTETEVEESCLSAKKDEVAEELAEEEHAFFKESWEEKLCQSLEGLTPHSPCSNNSAEEQEMAVETHRSTITSSFPTGPFAAWVDKERKQISKETSIILPDTCNKSDHRDTLVSLGILSESNDEINSNKNGSISELSNRTMNKNIGSNKLKDLEQNLQTQTESESCLLDENINKSETEIKSDAKQNVEVDEKVNTSLDNVNNDISENSKSFSKNTESSVKIQKIIPVENLALQECSKVNDKSPDIKNQNSLPINSRGESSLETEGLKSALVHELPMETEDHKSFLVPDNDKNVDSESVVSKLQESKKGKSKVSPQVRGTTSSREYELRNTSTTGSVRGMSSEIKAKKSSLSPKDHSVLKKKSVSGTNFKPKESSDPSDVEMQNVEGSETQSIEAATFQKGDSKIVDVHFKIESDLQSVKASDEEKMDCRPVEEFKFTQMIPCISINSHVTFSSIISVSFQSDGICLDFPRFKSSSKTFSALLSDSVVEHLLLYCDNYSVAFISIITSSAHGEYLRDKLKMNKKCSPYYSDNPESRSTDQLKISFLMQNVTDDTIMFLRSKFDEKKFNVIQQEAAFVMLTSSSPVKNPPPMSGSNILVYPAVGGIHVTDEDIACLAVGKKLNDTIIEFYLTYIYKEKIPKDFQVRTHIFNPFFCSFLTRTFGPKIAGKKELDVMKSGNKWIKNVDLFSKDFIFVPINSKKHWYLVVICFLTQLTEKNYEEITVDDNLLEAKSKEQSDKSNTDDNTPNTRRKDYPYLEKGKPCICFFDSFDKGTLIRGEKRIVAETLKHFLKVLWKSKNPSEPCNWEKLRLLKAACPQQENPIDCGLYLLQFVESFFKNPVPYFENPMPDLKNWFPRNVITHKRAVIKKVIAELKEQLKDKQPQAVHSEPSCSSDVIALS